ncbi:hypothetical protein [Pseudomonas sp. BN414]|nr:hypothetical protein [Pseudomonas sp. BN414]
MTPVDILTKPPTTGQHTQQVLGQALAYSDKQIKGVSAKGAI